MAKQVVVITGVSSGIGLAITELLLAKDFVVFGSVRKQEDADRIQSKLGASFMPLIMDVTDEAAVEECAQQVGAFLQGRTLAGLVNNAGACKAGPLLHQPVADIRAQLETNLLGPLIATQAFAPLLGAGSLREGKPGRIVNMSSVGGRFSAPFLGAYAASKHALEGASESLRRELQLYGIEVILIEPGFVNTPILDKAIQEDYSRYRETDYGPILDRFVRWFIGEGRKGMKPEVIGEAVYTALTHQSPQVCYTLVQQKWKNWTLPRLLPKRMVDRAIGKQLGLIKRDM